MIDMSAKNERELIEVSKRLHSYLKNRVISEKFGVLLYSPVPSPIDKIKDRYRMRILIKCKYDQRINELVNSMLKEFYNMKARTARVAVMLNPHNML